MTRIEAENWTLVQGFSTENTGSASGGARIKGSDLSIAELEHVLGDGVYDVSIFYWDESDGQSNFELRLNGSPVDAWIWNADPDQSTGNASSNAFVSHTLVGLEIRDGDVVEMRGTPDAGEALRIDYVEFTRTGDIPASGTTGQGAGGFGDPTATGTGSVSTQGQGAGGFGDPTAAGEGGVDTTGQGAGGFGDPTATGEGGVDTSGQGAGSLDPSGSGTGITGEAPNAGQGSGSFDPSATGTGSVSTEGQGSGSLDPTATGAGGVGVSGQGSGSLDGPSGSGTGGAAVSGQGSGSFDPTATGEGGVDTSGQGSGSIGVSAEGVGDVILNKPATVTIPGRVGPGAFVVSGKPELAVIPIPGRVNSVTVITSRG